MRNVVKLQRDRLHKDAENYGDDSVLRRTGGPSYVSGFGSQY